MSEQKQRHGCLTAFLILMIVSNSLTALLYSVGAGMIKQSLPDIPSWALVALFLLAVLNLVCSVALFKWKKWGFWGFTLSASVTLFVNLSLGHGMTTSLFGLSGITVLYGVLHIGKENKGWPQLE